MLVFDSGGLSRLSQRTRRAAALIEALRARARAGSAVDALLVALAEPGGTILTGDIADLEALSSHAEGVVIERV